MNCWNPETGISSQAQRWEGPETTKYNLLPPALAKEYSMDKKDRAILYGLAIGDGHISYRNRLKDNKYPYEQAELIIGHSPKQQEYIEHKASLIHSILGGKRPKVSETKHTLKSTGKTYPSRRIAKTHKYFRQMHRVLYSHDRTKRITGQVLSYLDEHSLALWFMDDGSISHNKNKQGEVTSLTFSICTQLEDEEQADWIVDWLQSKFGIEAKKYMSKGKYNIGGATQATLVLVRTIQDFVIPSMFYKIAPAMKFVFRKSAKHPNFKVDDDIVQTVGNKTDRIENVKVSS